MAKTDASSATTRAIERSDERERERARVIHNTSSDVGFSVFFSSTKKSPRKSLSRLSHAHDVHTRALAHRVRVLSRPGGRVLGRRAAALRRRRGLGPRPVPDNPSLGRAAQRRHLGRRLRRRGLRAPPRLPPRRHDELLLHGLAPRRRWVTLCGSFRRTAPRLAGAVRMLRVEASSEGVHRSLIERGARAAGACARSADRAQRGGGVPSGVTSARTALRGASHRRPFCLMSIKKEVKKDLISKFSINEKDTGSAEVQIAVLTERINNLIEHFKNHKHDNHSKRGLVALVNNRKKLLSYLSKKDNEKYNKLIKDLKIRG